MADPGIAATADGPRESIAPSILRLFAPWASLKLTVALLGMATFLVFAGTVAQVDTGIWTVVDEYFRCAFAWIELRIFFPRSWNVPGGFWFPGGWLIGGLLLLNVVAAHVSRFRIGADGSRLALGSLVLLAGTIFTGLIIAGVFDADIAATEGAAFWRVLLRLAKGGGAALVLMVGCIMVFRKRGGIVLLHAGVILLIISEFLTGAFAVEGRMRIEGGQSMNYVEAARDYELAFVDRSDPAVDRVAVIPASMMRPGTRVRHPELPVDVEVLSYMVNSRVVDARSIAQPNPATAGSGVIALALPEPEVSGTDMGEKSDVPATYVRLLRKDTGEPVGTYLGSPWFTRTMLERQTVNVDGAAYDLALRPARSYRPYHISLEEFRHDKYVGTETARNFSSLVHLVDESKGVDRTVKIWMNNPLRYAGETFYQLSYEPGRNVTILQVVRNHGWMIPYLSCMIVGAGMSLHMGSTLLNYLRRRRKAA